MGGPTKRLALSAPLEAPGFSLSALKLLTLTAECRPLEYQPWGSGQDVPGPEYYRIKVSRLNPY